MRRRTVLAALSGLTTAGAGCLGDGPGRDERETSRETSEQREPTGSSTVTATDDGPTATTTTVARQVTDRSLSVRSVDCGTGGDRATVTVGETDRSGTTVIVEGTVGGRNGCYTARLSDARLDDERLVVAVSAVEERDAGVCVQCLVDVTYRVRVALSGPPPAAVVVRHGERVVETATR